MFLSFHMNLVTTNLRGASELVIGKLGIAYDIYQIEKLCSIMVLALWFRSWFQRSEVNAVLLGKADDQ